MGMMANISVGLRRVLTADAGYSGYCGGSDTVPATTFSTLAFLLLPPAVRPCRQAGVFVISFSLT